MGRAVVDTASIDILPNAGNWSMHEQLDTILVELFGAGLSNGHPISSSGSASNPRWQANNARRAANIPRPVLPSCNFEGRYAHSACGRRGRDLVLG